MVCLCTCSKGSHHKSFRTERPSRSSRSLGQLRKSPSNRAPCRTLTLKSRTLDRATHGHSASNHDLKAPKPGYFQDPGVVIHGLGCRIWSFQAVVCFQGAGFRVQGLRCRVQGSGCRIQGSGFRAQGSGCRVQGSGVEAHGSGFRVPGSWFRVQGSGFRVQGSKLMGSGFRVQGSGFRVQGSGVRCHPLNKLTHPAKPSSLPDRPGRALIQGVQGYLAHKNPPDTRTLP